MTCLKGMSFRRKPPLGRRSIRPRASRPAAMAPDETSTTWIPRRWSAATWPMSRRTVGAWSVSSPGGEQVGAHLDDDTAIPG